MHDVTEIIFCASIHFECNAKPVAEIGFDLYSYAIKVLAWMVSLSQPIRVTYINH